MCVTVPNLIKIGLMVAEILWFNGFFQNGGLSPSWIRWAPIGTTHYDRLTDSIVVQNLVEIDAVVSITWLENTYSRPKNWGFRGISPLKWGAMSTKPPKGTSLRESASPGALVKKRKKCYKADFFRMAAIRHLGFVGRLLGPPTTATWWSPSLCGNVFLAATFL